MQYRRDIDGMRALAVLVVIVFHAGIPGFSGGFVGVDVFFVISGYLICGILVRELNAGEFSLARFYERRARRILPPLFLMIAICLAAGWFLLPPPAYASLAQSALPATLFWSNIHFRYLGADYFAPAVEYEPLLHSWSLAVEEQFYLVVPLAMWLAWRIDRRLLLPGAALATLISLVWSTRMAEATPAGAFYLIQSRGWELGAGAVLALLPWRMHMRREVAEVLALLGLSAILVAVFTYDDFTPFPGLAALAPVLGTVALIMAGDVRQTLVTRALSLPPVVWLGLVSYALYLWHWPVLAFARHLYASQQLPPLTVAAALGFALLLAWASSVFLEQPVRQRGRDAIIGRRGIFLSAFLAAGLLVGASYLVIQKDGFWSRVPEARQPYAEAMAFRPMQQDCYRSWRQDGEPCLFGIGKASPDVLVWGDSHAAALLPGLEIVLAERGLAGAATVTTACPPLPGYKQRLHGDDLDCSAANQAVFDWLEGHPEAAPTIVLAGRWAVHVTQSDLAGAHGSHEPLVAVSSGEAIELEAAPRAVESALREAVSRLTASGRRVVIVQGVPEMPYNVPRHFLAADLATLVPSAQRDRAKVLAREAPATAILHRLAQLPGVSLADPVAAMCDQYCPNSLNGRLLYRDDHHLSTYGSQVMVPRIFAKIEL